MTDRAAGDAGGEPTRFIAPPPSGAAASSRPLAGKRGARLREANRGQLAWVAPTSRL